MACLCAESLHYVGAAHRAVGVGDDIGGLTNHQVVGTVYGDTVNAGNVELDKVAGAIDGVHVDVEMGAIRSADAELIAGSVDTFASVTGDMDIILCAVDKVV